MCSNEMWGTQAKGSPFKCMSPQLEAGNGLGREQQLITQVQDPGTMGIPWSQSSSLPPCIGHQTHSHRSSQEAQDQQAGLHHAEQNIGSAVLLMKRVFRMAGGCSARCGRCEDCFPHGRSHPHATFQIGLASAHVMAVCGASSSHLF